MRYKRISLDLADLNELRAFNHMSIQLNRHGSLNDAMSWKSLHGI